MADEIRNLSERLERLSARILQANGYEIVNVANARRPESRVDIEIREPVSGDVTVVEVKLYRSPRIDRKVLRNAAVQIIHYKQERHAK